MSIKDRTLEWYSIEVIKKDDLFENEIILYYFLKDFFEKNKNSHRLDHDKTFWVEDYSSNDDILKVTCTFVIHEREIEIVDKDTKNPVGIKEKNQGDKEKQHLVLKLYKSKNNALLILEKTKKGISPKKLKETLNNNFIEFIKNSSYDVKFSNFTIALNPIINKDFIKNIDIFKKSINTLKLTVTSDIINKKGNEDIYFADDNKKDEVEIKYTSNTKTTFSKGNIVKQCQKYFDGNNEFKNQKVKRIVLEGKNDQGSFVKLDTESLKLTSCIKVQLDSNNQVNTEDIFKQIHKEINKKEDIIESILDSTLCEN